MTNSYPLLEAVAGHHKKILDVYDEYLANKGNVDAQTRLSYEISWELGCHASAELLVVHPLLKEHLEGEGVEEDRAEHKAITEALIELQRIQSGTQDHAAALKKIVERFKPHAQSEEKDDLPKLEAVISRQESQKAANEFRKIVSAELPINNLADPLATPVDKLKTVLVLSEEERGLGAAVGRN